MKIEYEVGTVTIDIASPRLKFITEAFLNLQKIVQQRFFQNNLLAFAQYLMSLQVKPLGCDKCSNRRYFNWKTRHGKKNRLLTIFGQAMLKQLQVQSKQCGLEMYLIHKLLDERTRKRIPFETVRKLGLSGALISLCVTGKIATISGW